MTGQCKGNSKDHCCWIAGQPCCYLEEGTVAGRKWACGLRRRYGDWDVVLASVEYKTTVAPYFAPMGIDCKTWPDVQKGQSCGECGYNR